MKRYYLYILTNRSGTLYIGVTNNIERRSFEHGIAVGASFTKKYNIDQLIYVEEYGNVTQAIEREKQLKNWRRSKKLLLISKQNPNFKNLITGEEIPRLRQV